MLRNGGYLDLDSYFFKNYDELDINKLEDMHVLCQSDYCTSHFYLLLEDDIYYFKDSTFPFREVLSSIIGKDLGLDVLDYDFASFNGLQGVISKCYNKEGKSYITLDQIINNFCYHNPNFVKILGGQVEFDIPKHKANNLEVIWMALDYYFKDKKEEVKKVIPKIVDMFIFKFLIRNTDATSYNVVIEYDNNTIDLCPIMDNEYSFNPDSKEFPMGVSYRSSFDFEETLEEFLSISSSEYVDRFLKLYSKFTDDYIYEMIDLLEKRYNYHIRDYYKEETILAYNTTRQIVDRVLEKLNIDYKRS